MLILNTDLQAYETHTVLLILHLHINEYIVIFQSGLNTAYQTARYNIDDGITFSLLKFADDTKMPRKVGTQDELQKYLDKMYKWAEDWQMTFNISNCKCLHIGHGNSQTLTDRHLRYNVASVRVCVAACTA